MRIKNILLIAVIALTTTNQCSENTSGKVINTSESEPHQNNMAGTYTGLIPCGDCPGIETTITVHPDNSYEIFQAYTGKDSVPFISSGLIKKGEKENIWVFKSRYHETFYHFEDSALRMLNSNKKEIDDQLEQHHILEKEKTPKNNHFLTQLTDKKWVLSHLQEVDYSSTEVSRKPHVTFVSEKNRVHGYAGCNSFFGEYQIKADGSIKLGEIASTKRYCRESMELERAFLKALHNCNKLSVNDNILQLKDSDNKTIAGFIENPGSID